MGLGPRLDLRVSPIAGDDPAAAGGDQAAGAVQPRDRSGDRRGTGQEPLLEARPAEGGAAGESVILREDRETGDEARDPSGSDELIGRLGGDRGQPARHRLARGGARHRQLRRCRQRRRRQRRGVRLRPARSVRKRPVRASHGAAARRRAGSSAAPPRRSSTSSRRPAISTPPLAIIAEATGATPQGSRRTRWRWSSRSTRRGSPRAASRNASRSRPRRPTATTRRWRG